MYATLMIAVQVADAVMTAKHAVKMMELQSVYLTEWNRIQDLQKAAAENKLAAYTRAIASMRSSLESLSQLTPDMEFRSYFETVLEEPVKLYRVYGGTAKKLSRFWSRTKPTGPGQAVFDGALDPDWGNTAQRWIEITVPKGTKIYEGIVSEVALRRGQQQIATGKLLGGGSQVYINQEVISPTWITNGGDFL